MTPFAFADAPWLVRADLAAAHRRVWERLAAPGTWWTGAERVAIAQATRAAETCALCMARRETLSPTGVAGEHTPAPGLPRPAVEAIHRIVTDQRRLSDAWLQSLYEDTFTDAHYVELLGVVTQILSVDDVHRGIGVTLEPLPAPQDGAPSRRRPRSAALAGAWVPTVDPAALEPEDAEIYGGQPRAPWVIKALSLVPSEMRALHDLQDAHYLSHDEMTQLDRGRALDRRQTELVAARVSALNECFY